MIDFRYHLVSIIAVFLALAIGLFVGSTALQGTVEDSLRTTANQVTAENHKLIQQNGILSRQVAADQTFAQASAARLLGGLLDRHSVALVTAPGADSQTVSGIAAAVRQAGGTVADQVSLTTLFFDTSAGTENLLSGLSQRYQPLSGGASSGTQIGGQQAAAAVLAAALVSKTEPATTTTAVQSQAVVSAFAQNGYLQLSSAAGGKVQPAQFAVVVAPATAPTSNDASPDNQVLIAVAQALRDGGDGTVLAGSLAGSGTGSAIDALASGAVSGSLTTVDNADTQTGQIMVVQALDEQLAGRKAAAYGVNPNAAPSPAPTPSATVTPAPTANSGTGKRAGHK